MTYIVVNARHGQIVGQVDLTQRQAEMVDALDALTSGVRAESILTPEQVRGLEACTPDTLIIFHHLRG